MIVAWHIVVGLKEVTLIVVEIMYLFKIISLLAHRGLCLHCGNFLPCWFSLGCVSGKLILEDVDELIYRFIMHYAKKKDIFFFSN